MRKNYNMHCGTPTNMRNRYVVIILSATMLFLILFFGTKKNVRSGIFVESDIDTGLVVSSNNQLVESLKEPTTRDDIAYCWENIRLGDSYFKQGNYEGAADAYTKAYAIDNGSKAVSGLWLARAYEKLGKYDHGVAVLDDMIKSRVLSEKGVQSANEIKSRLLAAKAQAAR